MLSGKTSNRLPVLTSSCSSEAATGESARRTETRSLWPPATATPKAAAAARPGVGMTEAGMSQHCTRWAGNRKVRSGDLVVQSCYDLSPCRRMPSNLARCGDLKNGQLPEHVLHRCGAALCMTFCYLAWEGPCNCSEPSDKKLANFSW